MFITVVLLITVSYKFTKELNLKLEYVFTCFETKIAFSTFSRVQMVSREQRPQLVRLLHLSEVDYCQKTEKIII
jgi:hypothetical protein